MLYSRYHDVYDANKTNIVCNDCCVITGIRKTYESLAIKIPDF